jgi:effector-binding domain-containing protein
MIDSPKVTTSKAQATATIRLTIPAAEIRKVMGPGIKEVMAAIAAQGQTPAGPWLTHHFSFPPGQFDFEICVPVEKPIAPAGRVKPGHLPAMKVARATYHGDYEGLPTAWPKLDAWIRAQGHTPREELWEVYTKGPESDPDPTTWRTELNRPLAKQR